MVLIKKIEILSSCYFRENIKENVFDVILDRKILSWKVKTPFLKSPKHCIFTKGLVHGFCQNLKFFLISLRQKNRQEKCV